jgi:hypothetical protein
MAKRLLILVIMTVVAGWADEFSYTLTVDNCSGGCGTNPFGTVDVKAIGLGAGGAGEVQVTVSLLNSDKFVSTGFPGSFGFDLVSPFNGPITLSNFSTGFTATSPQSPGSNHFDGFGNFEYFVTCTSCGSGGSNPNPGPLIFDVTEPNLLAADLAQLSSNPPGSSEAYFVADILGTNGHTGPVGAETPGTPVGSVPEPTSIILLGTVVVSILYIFRRRQQPQ